MAYCHDQPPEMALSSAKKKDKIVFKPQVLMGMIVLSFSALYGKVPGELYLGFKWVYYCSFVIFQIS